MNHSSTMSSQSRKAMFGASSISKSARLQHAPVIGEHARRLGQVLDGVAGMDDVEAFAFPARHLRCAPAPVRCDPNLCHAVGDALVRLDCGDDAPAARPPVIARAKLPRLEPTSRIERSALRSTWRCSAASAACGAKAFAVADIAPIGAAGNGSRRARRAIDARQALHQAAMVAEIDLQAAR